MWISQIISVLIFVNLILKNFWGRARPNDVVELDGKESFSPWFEITNACETNCSFVSGDASVGFSVIILYLITKMEEKPSLQQDKEIFMNGWIYFCRIQG